MDVYAKDENNTQYNVEMQAGREECHGKMSFVGLIGFCGGIHEQIRGEVLESDIAKRSL